MDMNNKEVKLTETIQEENLDSIENPKNSSEHSIRCVKMIIELDKIRKKTERYIVVANKYNKFLYDKILQLRTDRSSQEPIIKELYEIINTINYHAKQMFPKYIQLTSRPVDFFVSKHQKLSEELINTIEQLYENKQIRVGLKKELTTMLQSEITNMQELYIQHHDQTQRFGYNNAKHFKETNQNFNDLLGKTGDLINKTVFKKTVNKKKEPEVFTENKV